MYAPIQVIKVDFDFTLQEKGMGFNTDTDGLHFGKLCPNCSAIRTIHLYNNNNFTEKVYFKPKFNTLPNQDFANLESDFINSWFYFPKQCILLPYENKSLEIRLIPELGGYFDANLSSLYGIYGGKIIISIFPNN
jgi:hypothetical protein